MFNLVGGTIRSAFTKLFVMLLFPLFLVVVFGLLLLLENRDVVEIM